MLIFLKFVKLCLDITVNFLFLVVGTQPRCPSVGEYFSKGKGKEGDPDGEYVPLFDNKYHADPEPEHDSTDEGNFAKRSFSINITHSWMVIYFLLT